MRFETNQCGIRHLLVSAALSTFALIGQLSAVDFTHVVRSGDTLSGIARQHRVTVDELQKANGLSGTVIRVGQKLIIPANAAAPSPAVPNEALWRTARVTHVQKFGEWVIESVQRDGDSMENAGVRVRHGGKLVWASPPAIETAEDIYPGRGKPVAAESAGQAANLTAAGTPLLFVRRFTDTQRFVADTEIFALEAGFKRLARLDGVPNEGASFQDVNGDGIAEAIVHDPAFAGLAERLVDAYLPPVILRLGTNGFQPAADLMRTPAPTAAEIQKQAKELRRQLGGERAPWDVLLPALCQLAYAGHLPHARSLFEQSAPWTGPDRARRWREFETCLQRSQWWSALRPQSLPAKHTGRE